MPAAEREHAGFSTVTIGRPAAMPCLTPEQIEQLAKEAVPEAEAEAMVGHVEQCAECRRRLDEWLTGDGFLRPFRRAAGRDTAARSGGDLPVNSFPGYTLYRKIHEGGQGVVYEALQHATGRTVALKVLRGGALAGERDKWRFEQEVRLVASLKHPNIVTIHDSGITEGQYFFAMEYVRGQSLDAYVRLVKPSTYQAVQLFAQVCDAIAYAHGRGVIHRDLKPSNILVGESGTPQVLDFGLAKILGSEAARGAPVSLTGQIMGTLSYMAPEQTTGDPDGIDTRTDVYALGVILYELLTGSPPYTTTGADMAKAIESIRTVDPPRPSRLRRNLSSDLDAIVLKAMAKEPERRYQTAGQLREDLVAWLDGRPVSARSASSLYVIGKLARRHRYASAVVALLLAAFLGFFGVTVHYYRQAVAALDQERKTRQVAGGISEQFDKAGVAAQAAVQRSLLGWFLAEWHAGRYKRADQIRATVARSAPEYAEAMAFLLDASYPPERLQRALPPDAASLGHFVAGERAMKEGRREEASRLFRKVLDQPGDAWLATAAEARLQQLDMDGRAETTGTRAEDLRAVEKE